MTTDTLTVERDEVVEGAARRMLKRWVGSAIVNSSPVDSSLGIITERDILELIGRGGDPHTGYVADHFTPNPTCASRDWSLERAAEAISAGGFRHLIVLEKDRVVGIISIRDIVRSWAKAQASRAITIQIREAMTPDFGNCRSRCDAPPSGAADG